MEPVEGTSEVPKYRKRLRCYLCKRAGPCIQCSDSCYLAFHPLCNLFAGSYMYIREDKVAEASTCTALCRKHTPVHLSRGIEIPNSFVKSLKLRRQMDTARTLLDLVKRREKIKQRLILINFDLLEDEWAKAKGLPGLTVATSPPLVDVEAPKPVKKPSKPSSKSSKDGAGRGRGRKKTEKPAMFTAFGSDLAALQSQHAKPDPNSAAAIEAGQARYGLPSLVLPPSGQPGDALQQSPAGSPNSNLLRKTHRERKPSALVRSVLEAHQFGESPSLRTRGSKPAGSPHNQGQGQGQGTVLAMISPAGSHSLPGPETPEELLPQSASGSASNFASVSHQGQGQGRGRKRQREPEPIGSLSDISLVEGRAKRHRIMSRRAVDASEAQQRQQNAELNSDDRDDEFDDDELQDEDLDDPDRDDDMPLDDDDSGAYRGSGAPHTKKKKSSSRNSSKGDANKPGGYDFGGPEAWESPSSASDSEGKEDGAESIKKPPRKPRQPKPDLGDEDYSESDSDGELLTGKRSKKHKSGRDNRRNRQRQRGLPHEVRQNPKRAAKPTKITVDTPVDDDKDLLASPTPEQQDPATASASSASAQNPATIPSAATATSAAVGSPSAVPGSTVFVSLEPKKGKPRGKKGQMLKQQAAQQAALAAASNNNSSSSNSGQNPAPSPKGSDKKSSDQQDAEANSKQKKSRNRKKQAEMLIADLRASTEFSSAVPPLPSPRSSSSAKEETKASTPRSHNKKSKAATTPRAQQQAQQVQAPAPEDTVMTAEPSSAAVPAAAAAPEPIGQRKARGRKPKHGKDRQRKPRATESRQAAKVAAVQLELGQLQVELESIPDPADLIHVLPKPSPKGAKGSPRGKKSSTSGASMDTTGDSSETKDLSTSSSTQLSASASASSASSTKPKASPSSKKWGKERGPRPKKRLREEDTPLPDGRNYKRFKAALAAQAAAEGTPLPEENQQAGDGSNATTAATEDDNVRKTRGALAAEAKEKKASAPKGKRKGKKKATSKKGSSTPVAIPPASAAADMQVEDGGQQQQPASATSSAVTETPATEGGEDDTAMDEDDDDDGSARKSRRVADLADKAEKERKETLRQQKLAQAALDKERIEGKPRDSARTRKDQDVKGTFSSLSNLNGLSLAALGGSTSGPFQFSEGETVQVWQDSKFFRCQVKAAMISTQEKVDELNKVDKKAHPRSGKAQAEDSTSSSSSSASSSQNAAAPTTPTVAMDAAESEDLESPGKRGGSGRKRSKWPKRGPYDKPLPDEPDIFYQVHFMGWSATYDQWVPSRHVAPNDDAQAIKERVAILRAEFGLPQLLTDTNESSSSNNNNASSSPRGKRASTNNDSGAVPSDSPRGRRARDSDKDSKGRRSTRQADGGEST